MATPASRASAGPQKRPGPGDLPKQYAPAENEARAWRRWESSGAMGADPSRVREGSAPAYAILIPPPNVTARLHLGHALNNTLQDVLIRAYRMKGFEALWMPGTDHAGIATQTVVEKRLLETEGKRRTDFSRDEFIARVQAWKDEYEREITDQFRAMGCSCDYRRQRFTMDPVCARAVREAFFGLFQAGLIYRGKRLVNWDPVTQTALADDEVDMKEVEGHFYYLRYPLAHPWDHDDEPTPVTWSELAARGYPGADKHPDEEQAWITVATTRPETYLGDTAVAVNPRDPRAVALRDFCVELPLVGRAIPIIEDDYVVMPDPESSDAKAKYATGFLKVTPAHDPNDYEIGLRHSLPIVNVMAPDGSISDKHGWDDTDETHGAHVFIGKSRDEARKLVVREFEARGLLEQVKPYTHTVGHSYRSHAPIEPYFTDQWYVKVTDDRLRGRAQRALKAEQRSAESLEAWPEGGPALRAGSAAPGGPTAEDGLEPRGHGSESRATESLGDGSMSFYPPRYAKTYEAWHDNLRDWCISRQLWWGHRIPVWKLVLAEYAENRDALKVQRDVDELRAFARDDRLCIAVQSGGSFNVLDAEKDLEQHGELFICLRSADDAPAILEGATEDPDVLDTWFSSALWPLSTMGWPDPEQAARDTGIDDFPDLLDVYNPTTVLCTAREIITLWVSRMVMFNRFFRDQAPGGTALRAVSSVTLPTNISEARLHAPLAGFTGRDPFPRGAPSPTDMRVTRRNLPHIELEGATYFVTWRAAPTVTLSLAERAQVMESLAYADAQWCRIYAAVVMPDHVHALIRPWGEPGLRSIIASLKRYTARAINRARQQTGSLWQDEAFDHVIRNGDDLLDALDYIVNNPVRKELCRQAAEWDATLLHTDVCTAYGWDVQLLEGQGSLGGHGSESRATRGGGEAAAGPAPFRDVFIHAMIQDGDGRKMSKSLGNGVDPLDIIESHGADAMRFTLCKMTTHTQDVRMPVVRDEKTGKNTSPKFDEGRNFCNKIWNAARFAIGILTEAEQAPGAEVSRDSLDLPDRWMLSRLRASVIACDEALSDYHFANYAQTLYDVFWRDFCDWYLEAIKPTVRQNPAQQAVLRATLDALLRLLHPVAPFLTETIYERFSAIAAAPVDGLELLDSPASDDAGPLLLRAGWPRCADALHDEAAEATFERLKALATAIREVRAQQQVPPRREITLHLPRALADEFSPHAGLIAAFTGARIATEEPEGPVAAVTFEQQQLRLSNLADAVDTGAERDRLQKKIADLTTSLAHLDTRLDNPGYVDRAPAHLVQQTREQRAATAAELEAAQRALESLQ